MLFKEIDIPIELINAQQDGSLVIFAGAGVSKADPSNLPDLEELTERLAENTPFQSQVKPPYEQVLGRMEALEINIRKLTYDIFSSKTSNRLHSSLLQLFHKDKVRLVTTNFDTHFSSALEKHQLKAETYYAPALPLGKSFNGLVYLHGSIKKDLKSLVLTDKDFSQAYFLDDWATKFVKDMLLHNTVLFIGYSYNDVLMDYLSRGLPKGPRFILIPENEDEKNKDWNRLGLTPITYPNGEKNHLELILGVKEWSDHLSRGIFEHERKIREIASAMPPIDKEEADYILNRIQDQQCVKYFIKYANKSEWIKWTDEKGLLRDIFDSNSQIKEFSSTQYLADWLTDQFITEHHKYLIEIIEKYNQNIQPIFWDKLACTIRKKHESFSKTENINILEFWITFLIDKATDRNNNDLLLYILDEYKFSQDLNIQKITFKIFIFLLKPKLKIMKSEMYEYFEEIKKKLKDKKELDMIHTLQGQKINIAFSLNIQDKMYIINIWNELFKNKLDIFGEELFYVLQEYIREVHDFYHLFQKDSKVTDLISNKRPAIERHHKNNKNTSDNQELHFILDVFSDVIEWISLNSKHLTETALKWIDLDVIWLKRFAVFAMGETKCYTPSQKLAWLEKNKLMNDIYLYHELCRLMKEIYLNTNDKNDKVLLINLIKSLPFKSKPEALRYLYFLKESSSDCNLIDNAIDRLKDESLDYQFVPPVDFSFRHKIGSSAIRMGFGKPLYSVDDLLQMNLEEHLEKLLKWDERFNARWSLLSSIQKAIVRNFDWSLKLCNLLTDKSHQTTDLWSSILQGWADSNLNEKQWQTVLSYLTDHHFILKNSAYYSSDLLLEGIKKDKNFIPFSELDHAMDLAEKLWKVEDKTDCYEAEIIKKESIFSKENKEAKIDWMFSSVNSKAGKLSKFWHHILAIIVKKSNKRQIPQRIKNNLELILKESSYKGELGQIIIAEQIYFLYSIEKEWVQKEIIPYFDIEKNEKFQHFWEGYLYSCRWSNEFFIQMRPLFEKLFDRLQVFEDRIQERFIDYIAALSLYAEKPPLDNGWLFNFIQEASEKSLESFAYILSNQLKDTKPEMRSKSWRRWIKKYLEERTYGRPKPLNNKEKSNLVRLSLVLTDKQDYEEAIDLILQWKNCSEVDISLISYRLTHDTEEYNPIQKYPQLTLKLFKHLLKDRKRESSTYDFYELEKIAKYFIKRLKGDLKNKESFKEMFELLAQMGCPEVEKLQQELEK